MEKELSKEEILRKHCGKLPLSDHAGMRELQTDLSNAEDAMDEFATQEKKKEAIAFLKWMRKTYNLPFLYEAKNETIYQLYSSPVK